MPAKPLWSVAVRDSVGGLLLAREANRLGFFAADQLAWVGRAGEVEARIGWDSPVVLATISEAGSVSVAVTNDNRVRSLSPDLRTDWERPFGENPLALAIDPLGLFVGVSDTKSSVTVYDARGDTYQRIKCPRPVVKLSFLPGRGLLICVGDLGWIGAYDLGKRDWAWRGTLFFNASYLAVAASDTPILVGSFTDSVAAFDANGNRFEWRFVPPPARDVQFTADGKKLFLLTRDGTLRGFSIDGKALPDFEPRLGVAHFRVDGFGKRIYLATLDGRLEAV